MFAGINKEEIIRFNIHHQYGMSEHYTWGGDGYIKRLKDNWVCYKTKDSLFIYSSSFICYQGYGWDIYLFI